MRNMFMLLEFFLLKIQQLYQDIRICVSFYWFFSTFSWYMWVPFCLQDELFNLQVYFRKALFYSTWVSSLFFFTFSGPQFYKCWFHLYCLESYISALISVLLSRVLGDIWHVCVAVDVAHSPVDFFCYF